MARERRLKQLTLAVGKCKPKTKVTLAHYNSIIHLQTTMLITINILFAPLPPGGKCAAVLFLESVIQRQIFLKFIVL